MMSLIGSILLLVALVFLFLVPLGVLLLVAWFFKWFEVVIGIIFGNSDVIHTIKESTCESGKKKDETWLGWLDRAIDRNIAPRHATRHQKRGPTELQRWEEQYRDWPM